MHDSLMPTGGFSTLFNLFYRLSGVVRELDCLLIYLPNSDRVLTVGWWTPEFLGAKLKSEKSSLPAWCCLSDFRINSQLLPLPLPDSAGFPDPLAGITILAFTASQVVYEYTSAAANNGSGFEGLLDNTLWWNLTTIVSFAGRTLHPDCALLLLADSMTHKQPVPETAGTLRTAPYLLVSQLGSF